MLETQVHERLESIEKFKCMLHILENLGMTRTECKTTKDPVSEYKGPVLNYDATISSDGDNKGLVVCSCCHKASAMIAFHDLHQKRAFG